VKINLAREENTLMKTERNTNVAHLTTLVLALIAVAAWSATPARAQNAPVSVPQFEASAGYSYVRANAGNSNGGFHLNGANASFTYNFTEALSAVADVGGYRFGGLPAGVDSTMYTYLFGPRYAFRKYSRFTPFVQVLLGSGRLKASSGGIDAGENGFAMAMGGGLDLSLRSRFAVRLLEADYLLTRFPNVSGSSATQNNVRISAGVLFRFGKRN
jgi:hypothetical protein